MTETSTSPANFLAKAYTDPGAPAELYLLTGERGCGKTTWCLELVRQAHAAGLQPAGLVSPAVFQDGIKTGIDLMDVSSGERQRLAVKREAGAILPKTAADMLYWRIDLETIAWGNQILEQLETKTLLILDELGPLELRTGGGLNVALKCIEARDYRLACVVVRPELLPQALERWPWSQAIRAASQASGGGRG